MIAVVIVTFSAEKRMLDACVSSALSEGEVQHVIVVDNGGRAIIDANVEVVRPPRNLGFGGGANAGFQRAVELGATAVMLLNDDIEAEHGWLPPLVRALDGDPKLGAVQPKLLLAGSEPPRINSLGVEVGGDGAGHDIGYGEIDGPEFTSDRLIESFTGGAVLFRAEFLRATGGFDESYFLYYEDLDLARRGTALGWTYRCVPASMVWHRVSASTSQLGDTARYLQERNRLRFAFRFTGFGTIRRALWLSIRRVRWSPRGAHSRALLVGLGLAPKALLNRLRAR